MPDRGDRLHAAGGRAAAGTVLRRWPDTDPVDRIATGATAALLDGARVPPATSYASELILRHSA